MGVLFLVGLYFSFSRGALLALAAGAVVLLVLAKHRFEVLGNMVVIALPTLWVISQARDYPGLVGRSVGLEVIEADGLSLVGPLVQGFLLALVAQVLFTVLVRAFVKFIPDETHGTLRVAGMVVVVVLVAGGLHLGWNAFQQVDGFNGLKSQLASTESESEVEAIPGDNTQRFSSLSTARVELWKIAWENWREHPLTGTGGDTYSLVFQEKAPEGLVGGQFQNPHSIWMSLLSDTGIFAFLAFAAFCVGCLALACYNTFSETGSHRSRALIAGSTAAITAYLVSSSIDWNWYIPASTVPFFALAALAVGMKLR
jgi:O-antigen ligase